MARRVQRPDVPEAWVQRLDQVLGRFPRCALEPAWTGVRWRVGSATVAHVFGGEDQRFRLIFRAEPDEVMAFGHLGDPYFTVGWSDNGVGLLLPDDPDVADWEELGELLTDSYCLQAPMSLAAQVERPEPG